MSTELALQTIQPQAQRPSLNLSDMLIMLFKHKWQILLFGIAGLAAAVAAYFALPHTYEAQAKLLVRYVVDKSAVDGLDDSQVRTSDQHRENVINSEVEILSTPDLAMQVASAIGVDRILHGNGPNPTLIGAARSIQKALTVTPVRGTDIISLSYTNTDPQLAVRVLQEFVDQYFDKHLEIHRSVGEFEFATREADQLKARLIQTEEDLKQLKSKAGISSLTEITTTLNSELVKGQQELDSAKAEFAAQQARVKQIESWIAGGGTVLSNTARLDPSSEIIHEYQALVSRATYLRQTVTELLSRYTAENRIVIAKQALLKVLEKQQLDLEKQFPSLIARLPAASPESLRFDLGSEKAQLAATEARIEALKTRLSGLQDRAKTVWDLGPQIAQLEREREVEEKNYKYYESSVEKARIDEALNPAKMPNISVVQKPALAEKASGVGRQKIVLGVAGAGLVVGIAIALLNELLFDRSVKRRREIETQLRIPLLLSIPYLADGRLRLHMQNAGVASVSSANGSSNVAAWESDHFIRPFCEALRDRLVLYFERKKMTKTPKLVALTGCSRGAGASTIAAGLAAALSETCEGEVLLVDKEIDPKRFYALVTEYKASDFAYVIFDIPSLSSTSSTLAMASLMDKVLLVVEAEVSNREVVKRAYAELVSAQANVSAIFNKGRSYGPKWLESEL
jgi:polysaccharide biosynthesis transport protein